MKKKKESKKVKKILNILIVMFFFIIVIYIYYSNIFKQDGTKEIKYMFGDYQIESIKQDIIDGKVELPYPREIGLELKVGETFLGYDSNNDGEPDYLAGELMPVSIFGNMEIAVITAEENIPFSAWLYDDTNHITGVELKSSEYTESTLWDYEDNVKYLVINSNFTIGTGGTIEITLPIGMQWFDTDTDVSTPTWTPVSGNISSVEFVTLNEQHGTVYKNQRTGTLTYTYNSLATDNNQVIIPVAFDENIWDGGQGTNSQISGVGVNVIDIKMTEGTNTYTKSLSNINFERSLAPSIGIGSMNKNISQGVNHSLEYTYISNLLKYYEKVEFIFELPTDGENYVEYVGENIVAYPGSMIEEYNFIVDQSVPGKIIYTVYDVLIDSHNGITPIVFANTELFHLGETLTMSYELIATSYSGTIKHSKVVVNYMKISDSVNVTSHETDASVEYGYNDRLEVRLGGAYFRNQGALGSGNLKIEYIFDNINPINNNQTPNILVRSISIAQKGGKQVNLNYTLIDGNNNEVGSGEYTFTSKATVAGTPVTIYYLVEDYNKNNIGTEGFIPLVVDDVSIKEVSYVIDTLDAGVALYHTGASLAPYSSGNYYGKYLVDTPVASTFKLTEYNFDGSVKKEQEYTEMTTRRTNPTGNSLALPKNTYSQVNYQAGEEFYLKFRIYMFSYPYRSSQYSEDPVLYAALPSGVEISKEDIYGEFDGEIVSVNIDSWYDSESDKNIYAISFNPGEIYLGGPTLDETTGNFLYADASPHLYINVPIMSNPSLNFTPINLYNTFYVGERIGSTFQQGHYSQIEPYDFDKNGILDKRITTYMDKVQTIGIYPNTNEVEVINEININDREFTSTEMSYMVTDTTGNIGSGIAAYNLRIQNNSNGLIAGEDFYYYMPVSKSDVTYPNEMNVVNSLIDFELTSEPKVSGDNGLIYDVKYTTKTDLVDTSGNLNLLESDWKTLTEISSFADVTMIKITGLPRTIVQPNTEDIISLNLKYETKSGYTSNGYDSGKVLKFNSYGWQKYLEGGVENTENIFTQANNVSIMLRYVTEYDEQILASYDSSDDKTARLQLPQYFEQKEIYILSVREYNVDLVPKSEILANPDIVDTNITDRNFSITALMGTSGQVELSDYTGTPISLGVAYTGYPSNIIFRIENYENMADEASTKYVDVVLGDDQGIRYTLRLNISRNVKHITEPVTSIAEGMLYKLIDNGKTEITITRDSSMTMQYDFTYVPADHDNVKLEFSTNLPIGTKIRMIDSSDLLVNDEGDYIFSTSYYYYETTAEVPNILLSEFQDMRTQENFDIGTDLRNERTIYTFIIEFETNYLPVGNYTASIVPIQTGGTEYTSFDLSFILTEKREFDIETTNTDYVIKDDKVDVLVNFNSSQITGIDTKYRNEVLALRIRFNQDIPIGSYIEIQDKIYLLEESDFILNYGNYFLIPLGNIEDIENIQYTLHSPMDNYVAGSIYHEIVYLEEPQGASYADVTSSFTVVDPPPPAMRLTVNNGNELILVENVSQLPLTFDYIDYDDTTIFTTRLYIMEKSEGAYLRQTNLLESVIIDGKIVIPLTGIATLNPVDLDRTDEIILNLNEALINVNATYRIVMETNHLGEIKYEDLVNFIVIDKE